MALNEKSYSTGADQEGEGEKNQAVEMAKEVANQAKQQVKQQAKQVAKEAVKKAAKKAALAAAKWIASLVVQVVTAIIGFLGPWGLLIVGIIAIIALIVVVCIAAFSVPTGGSIGSEYFHGVRIVYENEEKARASQENNYNQLVFDFLTEIVALSEVKSITLTLPENITGDLTTYKVEATNNMVYAVVEGLLESESKTILPAIEGGDASKITAENLSINLGQIDHFGFTEPNFTTVSVKLTEVIVNKVESDRADGDNTNDLIVFEDSYSYTKSDFETKLTTCWQSVNLNKYKFTTEKVFVKDCVNSVQVDGTILNYIFMPNTKIDLGDRMFRAIVKDDSVYKVSYMYYDAEAGTESEFASAVVDSSWCEYDESKESYFFKEGIDVPAANVRLTEFTNIDINNAGLLSADNISAFDAMIINSESANICFAVLPTAEGSAFSTILLTPTCSHAYIQITDQTPNGMGTGITFEELVE